MLEIEIPESEELVPAGRCYVLVRRYAPNRERMLAAVRLALGLPETEGGGRLFVPLARPVLREQTDVEEAA